MVVKDHMNKHKSSMMTVVHLETDAWIWMLALPMRDNLFSVFADRYKDSNLAINVEVCKGLIELCAIMHVHMLALMMSLIIRPKKIWVGRSTSNK